MNRTLIRTVVVLLVPSVIVDPAWSTVLSRQRLMVGQPYSLQPFASQALAERAHQFPRNLLTRRVTAESYRDEATQTVLPKRSLSLPGVHQISHRWRSIGDGL